MIVSLQKKRSKKEPRFVPLDKKMMSMIQHYLDNRKAQSPYLFDSGKNHLTRQWVYLTVRTAGENGLGKHVHPHTLRNSVAMHFIKTGGGSYENLRKLQIHLGHASIETTAGYLKYSQDEVRKAYEEAFPEEE